MEARTALAALHFNENAQRPQATTRAGQKQYAMSFPKSRKGEPIAKEVKVNQTFEYVDELMTEVIERRNLNKSYREARRARQEEETPRPPPIAQSTPIRPNKADIVRAHISRFNR